MNEEMKTLEKTRTYVTKLPERKKVVRCKGVFTVKHKADGSIVANGFTQIHGLDFHETFTLVEKVEFCYKLFYP